eukprot:gene37523-63122_t
MLLVLGCAFISRSVPNGTAERRAEIKKGPLWTFNSEGANVYASILLLATFSLVVPTAFANLHLLGKGTLTRPDGYYSPE